MDVQAVFPGRFQPWTHAHEEILRWYLERHKAERVMIIVGAAPRPLNGSNFLTNDERLRIISGWITRCELNTRVMVTILEGGDPDTWARKVRELAPEARHVLSRNPFVTMPLKRLGFDEVGRLPEPVNHAEELRIAPNDGRLWADRLGLETLEMLDEWGARSRLNSIQQFGYGTNAPKYPFLCAGRHRLMLWADQRAGHLATDAWRTFFDVRGLPFSHSSMEPSEIDIARLLTSPDQTILGINIARPFKRRVRGLLPVSDLRGVACAVPYANAIAPDSEGGHWLGTNVDGDGMLMAVMSTGEMKRDAVVIYGCGGAGTAIAASCAALGFRRFHLVDINRAAALESVDVLQRLPSVRCSIGEPSTNDVIALVVNATGDTNERGFPGLSSIGLNRYIDPPMFCEANHQVAETGFLKYGRSLGSQLVDGVQMFSHQAALTFKFVAPTLSKPEDAALLERCVRDARAGRSKVRHHN